MIDSSEDYREAVVDDVRRTYINALVDITDPDTVFEPVSSSEESAYSKSEQIHDKDIHNVSRSATLESKRWVLDGSFYIFPDSPDPFAKYGFVGNETCGEDGTFSPAQFVEERFSGVGVLQVCMIFFPNNDFDGVPEDFTVSIMQGGSAIYEKQITGNTESKVIVDGFTVNNPDAIRIDVSKMSKGYRRLRVLEIVPGIIEVWSGDDLSEFSLKQQGDVSCTTLPYGTCEIALDNTSRRFEPRNKSGIFSSIEERQGIDISIGVQLKTGGIEYKGIGKFFQKGDGWKTGDNTMTMRWNLVDIVGLLSDRTYIAPEILPTTLDGWARSIVTQLGSGFVNSYHVDPDFSSLPLSANSEDLNGISCGDLIRFVAMASGTWPRADGRSGKLTFEPMWNQGNKITLENMDIYPILSANESVAAIIFELPDGTKSVFGGNSTSSDKTISIKNPFITTHGDAAKAARNILSVFGGNIVDVIGRGDPSSEIGDVDTVWVDESQAYTARRAEQEFILTDGVLKSVNSKLIQSDGALMYENRVEITEDSVWKAPAGVSSIRIILVGPGENGGRGTDGSYFSAGVKGKDGKGGSVWSETIMINPEQEFQVSLSGEHTVFGPYSAENGSYFPYGYTDIISGKSYARTGVKTPLPGSGDGGEGGAGGLKEETHFEKYERPDGGSGTRQVVDQRATPGETGSSGAFGSVVIYYNKG